MSTQKLRESINLLVNSSLATNIGGEAQHFAAAALFVAQAVELLEKPRVSEILSNVTVQSDFKDEDWVDVECEVVDESGVDLKTKLISEKRDLDEKRSRLEEFMISPTVATLPINEVELLRLQRGAMELTSFVLGQRIYNLPFVDKRCSRHRK